jgi:3-oxoadipate enol-lactonase
MASIVDRRGPRFAWREAGTGSPEPIVLLHGLGGSRTSWDAQLTGLSARHRVVAWDLPGYGESAPLDQPLTFGALADAVADFVEELQAVRVHLVGISFGGMIAQHAAVAHPELIASLVLMSTSPCFGLDGTDPDGWRAARLAALDAGQQPADFADAVLRSLAGPHITDVALAGQRAAMARISARALRQAIDCLITHDGRDVLGSIAAPTLCIVGALDDETPVAYSQALAAGIPGAALVVVPGAGHLLPAEAPDTVNELIALHVDAAGVR